MSGVNFPWITHPILYIEISQPQPVTAVSRQAARHHWSASCSWHRTWWNILLLRRSLCQTLWSVDTELMAYFADCKNSENCGLKFCVMNAKNTHCWLHLPKTCCHLLHLRHTWMVVFSVCGELRALTAGKRDRLTKSLGRESHGF